MGAPSMRSRIAHGWDNQSVGKGLVFAFRQQNKDAGVRLKSAYGRPQRLRARSMARITAWDLLMDSSYSSSGTESATMPAPAWT